LPKVLKQIRIFSEPAEIAAMLEQKQQIYRFDNFRLDVSNRQLLRAGSPVALPAKAFDMLVVLVENAGRLIGKDELFRRVWPDQIVEESNLTVQISAIRRALGERKENPQYIATVPGHGYRFTSSLISRDQEEVVIELHSMSLLTVKTESANGTSDNALITDLSAQGVDQLTAGDGETVARPSALGLRTLLFGGLAIIVVSLIVFQVLKRPRLAEKNAAATPIRSIAVLPFKPLVASERDESLEIGMADTLITSLSRVQQLTVRPTSAVRQYTKLEDEVAKAGRELLVDAVLDGSIQKSGDRVRVGVRLVSVEQGHTLWAEQFDEKFLNIFAVQDAISRKVVGALAVRLVGDERTRLGQHDTDSSEAYELYLKGRYFWNKFTLADHQKATEYFNQAIAKDPGYALAYAGLADTYGASATNGWLRPTEAYPKAKLTVQKALSLDDTLAEAHANLGALFMFYDMDWVSAEREYRRAIELNPDYEGTYGVYSYLLCALGRLDEGVEKARQGLEANPLSGALGNDLALAYYQARRYDEAINQYQETLEMEPTRAESLLGLGMVYEQKGKYEDAINEYQKAIKSLGRTSPGLAQLGHAYAMSGKRNEAISIAGELRKVAKQSFRGSYDSAILYTGLGEQAKAFEQLNKAFEERSGWIIYLKVEPQFDSLRADPRYASLLQRINLSP
jgi:DNA-binding winged helix-turn-helix (wHTH) protein/TolB-like protein/Flp pilus assembly protein TadD